MLLVLCDGVHSVHKRLGLLLLRVLFFKTLVFSRYFLSIDWFSESSVILWNNRASGLDLLTELLVVADLVNINQLISDDVSDFLSLADVLVLTSRIIGVFCVFGTT